jgi:phytoene desaturase
VKTKIPKSIAVIGAGIGGLATASLLGSLGHKVTLYEKNATPGGKMQEYSSGGYRFDTGPSLLTMPHILRELFARCGEDFDREISLLKPEPLCRYIYPDGSVFDNFQDINRTLNEIEKIAPVDHASFSDFMEYSEKLFERTNSAFLLNPLYDIRDLKHLNLVDFFRIDAFTTVAKRVDSYFNSEYLKKFFKRFTTYNGSSPFQAPATLNVIPHVEITGGGFYVKGGIYRITESLEQLALNKGVSIKYNTSINKILIENKSVKGVYTDHGEEKRHDLVVSNSDAFETIKKLIGPGNLSKSRIKKQEKIEPSCSGFVLLLATNKKWDILRHHNVFFSENYKNEFRQIFRHKILPDDPTIYIANTSYTNPCDAPVDGSNLFILVNAPYLTDQQNWKALENEYPSTIINKLEEAGLDELSSSIRETKVLTPRFFYDRYRSNRGSIYGTSSNSLLSAFIRPRNKIGGLKGLYMTGGSTHPGGGIPLVILSAFHAVELIQRHEN